MPPGDKPPVYRIGHGYDVHRFTDGDHVMLGGVRIPHQRGLAAHSDGDVVIHALCDALLGALALGDLGRHFPDTDARYKNIDSSVLLDDVYTRLTQSGYIFGNADITVIAQQPALAPYIQSMCQHLSKVLQASENQVNVKATTTETLGFVGRQEGIAAHAVVIIYKSGG